MQDSSELVIEIQSNKDKGVFLRDSTYIEDHNTIVEATRIKHAGNIQQEIVDMANPLRMKKKGICDGRKTGKGNKTEEKPERREKRIAQRSTSQLSRIFSTALQSNKQEGSGSGGHR